MKLYSQAYGTEDIAKKPIVILHGLFGSSTNWGVISKQLAQQYRVYALDLRNHGRSPHADGMSYADMADDILGFLDNQKLQRVYILGHSLGGKAAMQFCLDYPERICKSIIVDIAPKSYSRHHEHIFTAIDHINHADIRSRQQADTLVQNIIPDTDTRLFLLTNLIRGDDGRYHWRINIPAIKKNYQNILAKPQRRFAHTYFDKPVCFIRGENSDYINDNDLEDIKLLFKQAQVISIKNAGHWVHTQQPAAFLEYTCLFLNSKTQNLR